MVSLTNPSISRSRKVILLAVIPIAVLTVGVYAYIVSLPPYEGPRVSIISPPLEFSIRLNRTDFLWGDNFTVKFSLKNIGNKTITLHWRNGYILDFVIKNINGLVVYQWGKEHVYPSGVVETILNPDEERTGTMIWDFWPTVDLWICPKGQYIPRGTYYITGTIPDFSLIIEGQSTRISLETPSITFKIR